MPYQISRGGQLYGPYTLEDLQRYVASGNVLATDLAKSEEMADWVPVSQILYTTGATPHDSVPPAFVPPATPYAQPAIYGSVSPYPEPPNLHWALVLLIGICTCGVFFIIWDLVQVLWVKRVEPQTRSFPYFIAYVILSFLNGGVSWGTHDHGSPLSALTGIAALVLIILYRFAMKASLERYFNGPDPIGLRLGPVMTFFFGGLYFQYHFNRINQIKQAARLRGY
jgi:hypothetical protein